MKLLCRQRVLIKLLALCFATSQAKTLCSSLGNLTTTVVVVIIVVTFKVFVGVFKEIVVAITTVVVDIKVVGMVVM